MTKSISYILILLMLLITSCSKVTYYAYQDKEGYYTFEVRKEVVIYRASSTRYTRTIPDGYCNFIWLLSTASINKPNNFIFRPITLKTAYLFPENKYKVFFLNDEGAVEVSSKNNGKTKYIRGGANNRIQLFTIGSKKIDFTFGNGDVKVTWMPPRLERVKKIDYEKLEELGQTGGSRFNYENPTFPLVFEFDKYLK